MQGENRTVGIVLAGEQRRQVKLLHLPLGLLHALHDLLIQAAVCRISCQQNQRLAILQNAFQLPVGLSLILQRANRRLYPYWRFQYFPKTPGLPSAPGTLQAASLTQPGQRDSPASLSLPCKPGRSDLICSNSIMLYPLSFCILYGSCIEPDSLVYRIGSRVFNKICNFLQSRGPFAKSKPILLLLRKSLQQAPLPAGASPEGKAGDRRPRIIVICASA